MVLFFIDLSTRKVEIAGIAGAANGFWMSQIDRNLTDSEDGILTGKRYLIHDRDPCNKPLLSVNQECRGAILTTDFPSDYSGACCKKHISRGHSRSNPPRRFAICRRFRSFTIANGFCTVTRRTAQQAELVARHQERRRAHERRIEMEAITIDNFPAYRDLTREISEHVQVRIGDYLGLLQSQFRPGA